MSRKYDSSWNYAANYDVQIARPLDNRLVVDHVSSLTAKDTFGENAKFAYDGMLVSVVGDGLYMLDSAATLQGFISSNNNSVDWENGLDNILESGWVRYTDKVYVDTVSSTLDNKITKHTSDVNTQFEKLSDDIDIQFETLSSDLRTYASTAYKYKGSVSTYNNLTSIPNPEIGDVYNVRSDYGLIPAGTNYAWQGEEWDALGGIVDLSEYIARGTNALFSSLNIGEYNHTGRANQNGSTGWYIWNHTADNTNKQLTLYLSDKQPTTTQYGSQPPANDTIFNTLCAYITTNSLDNVGTLSIINTTHYTDLFTLVSLDSSNNSMTVKLVDEFNCNEYDIKDVNSVLATISTARPFDCSIRVTDKSLGVVSLFPITVAEGYSNIAAGGAAHAEGQGTAAYDDFAHAEGSGTIARSYASHTEGQITSAFGQMSHAEGHGTLAEGYASHAEGHGTLAEGRISHAEGYATGAFGYASHAENELTSAIGVGSYAGGFATVANGNYSHAVGYSVSALGTTSCACGRYTVANNDYQFVVGKYNNYDDAQFDSALFVVGNGGTNNNRSNAFAITSDGGIMLPVFDEAGKFTDDYKTLKLIEKNDTITIKIA